MPFCPFEILVNAVFFPQGMSKTAQRRIGDLGEDIAVRYLTERGFVVCARNVAVRGGELDLIAEKGAVRHFIEVKTVTASAGGAPPALSPEAHLTEQKLACFARAAVRYRTHTKDTSAFQLDALLIVLDIPRRMARIRYLPRVR